jgi:protein-S-isoprenylcysteine O-methyltransferase Ste14
MNPENSCHLFLHYVVVLVGLLNVLYWAIMEFVNRTAAAKAAGTEKSSIVNKEFGASTFFQVGSIISIYVVCSLFRVLNFTVLPITLLQETGNSNCFLISMVGCISTIFSLSAIALRTWSMRTLGNFFSRRLAIQGKEHQVVRDGPYAYVRHPGYAATILLYVPFSIVVSGDWIIGPVMLIQYLWVLLHIRIPTEEQMLLGSEHLGTEYKKYMGDVRSKIIPYIC